MDATIDIISKIFFGIASLTLSAFSKVLWDKFTKMETRIDNLELSISEVRDNYLTRFAEINANISATELRIVSAIKDLEIRFIGQCQVQHTNLKHEIEQEFKKEQ